MFKSTFLFSCLLITNSIYSFAQGKADLLKKEAIQYIEQNQDAFTNWSDQIWQFAENPFQDTLSANLLIEVLKREGFQLEEKIAGVESMFLATYGAGKPIVGLFGEYDADLGASNEVVPFRKVVPHQHSGHGAGHNLLGVGSLATALAIKNLISKGELKGTIKYFGSTAEGGLGGRTYLARDGYFEDLDLSLYWHPSPVTAVVTRGWDAMVEMEILIIGKKAQAIQEPERGENAMYGLIKLLNEIQKLEEQPDDNRRINYTINNLNQDLRFITDSISLKIRLQHPDQLEVMNLLQKIKKEAKEAEKVTELQIELVIKRAFHEFLPNNEASKLLYQNMQKLTPISYSNEEKMFAQQMQSYLGKAVQPIRNQILPFQDSPREKTLYGYVSDIGDASWFAPEIYFVTTIIPPGISMHDWPTTAFTAHSIGHKGMLYAAKAMTTTIIDYLSNKSIQIKIAEAFKEKTRHYQYQSLLPLGDIPVAENTKAN